jgi:thioredoxin reductase (NADPH)
MYDIAIIGAGPAGLSAALLARSRNKKTLVISNLPEESLLAKARQITNYPGMPNASGSKILEEMVAQAQELGVDFVYERVTAIASTGENFQISAGQDVFQALSVILAVGKNNTKPFVGENEYIGRGVSHCATCDGMFFKTATVAVVGLSSEALKEANFLAEIGAQVTFISPKPVEGLDERIEARLGSVVEIKGDMMGVTELVYKKAGSEETDTLSCTGVFVLRPSIAPSMLIAGLKAEEDRIVVDNKMQTNIKGVFAAGDCIGSPLYIAKAVGEGQMACYHATEYLD